MPEHTSPHDAAALLDAVERSPKAVAAHDKAAWVGIFAADGQVNDPVGSTPHVGTAAIERFFDTFIAPNTIEFDVEHDVVAGMSVIRDLTVYTTMSTGVTMEIPMHLRYDLTSAGPDDTPQIQRLFAYWELPFMIWQLLTAGGRGLLASLILGPQLVRNQGLAGGAGFLRGLAGVHKRGKRRVADLVGALADRDAAAVSALLTPDAALSLDGVSETSIAEFTAAAQHLEATKLLAAGHSVTATVHLDDRRGVGLFEFSRDSAQRGRIAAVRLYF